ncbi:hypothetical protein [Streptacidiphilus rugosus]|uniref:hypothetical protein n=1 Tax=Streptacidiphilus rugosus TaxID=405783 RepID=UPI0005648C7D|nr:hypothetical protein [Streptacidiphilus rugosus]
MFNRLTRNLLVGASAWVLFTGLTTGNVSATTGYATNVIEVDLGKSQGTFPYALGHDLSSRPFLGDQRDTTVITGTSTPDDQMSDATVSRVAQLKLQHTRLWLTLADLCNATTHVCDDAAKDPYLASYDGLTQSIFLNWGSDYDEWVKAPKAGVSWTAAQLQDATDQALTHLKTAFPKLEYIEVENESISPTAPDIADYMTKYLMMSRLVKAVNGLGLPGPKLKVGGPTTDIFSTWRIGMFLAAYQASTDPDKELDFISYHQYITNSGGPYAAADGADPAVAATERSTLDGLLTKYGQPAGLPVFVSETGVFPGTCDTQSCPTTATTPNALDFHIQAAALASLDYYYANQHGITPMHWTIAHGGNARKSLFDDYTSATPQARPYYDMIQMQTMLPATRYQSVNRDTTQLSAPGIGVYSLAAADATTVAVMSWNYQWAATQPQGYDSEIHFANLPPAFQTSNVLVTRYYLPASTLSGDLKPVESFVVGPRTAGTYYGENLPLGANEIRLTVLTLTNAPVGTRY